MGYSKYFATVKRNYRQHLWGIDKVRDAVVKEWITEAEFKEITGADY